jgi:peptide/nickel transport system ATP-binding protein
MERSRILDVSDLSVAPVGGGKPILSGISFSVDAMESYGIYGESGAGKTVLSRALANWLPGSLAYTSGRIGFAGKDILDRREAADFRVGRDIAYIGSKPQSALDPTVPVGPQILEKLLSVRPNLSRKEATEKILHLLAEVRIPSPRERFHDYPNRYSGGMMQRAMIVDALCADPAVLIADNVVQPLDVTIAAQTVRLLRDLCERHKMALIFLASSLASLAQIAERVGVLHEGRLVEEQPIAALLKHPQTDYTKRVIAEVPRIWSGEEEAERRPTRGNVAPLMSVVDAERTYLVRKRGHFNAYNRVMAVRGVTFDIRPGDNFGIVGESGCGKSTLTRLLAWLETPDAGEIRLDDVSLASLSSRELLAKRREFQLLLQDPYNSLPPRSAVGRMIAEGLLLRGELSRKEIEARVRKAMAEVGLADSLYHELPTALSTGQRQRISIARALVLDPKLLILDETLSSLDQGEQAKLLELFGELQAKNDLTYVFISHDLAMVRKVCTRIAVMYLGEIVELADNHDLFFDPQHPYTKALLSAAPTLEEKPFDATKYLLEGEPPSPIDIAPGCSFASRCPSAFGRCRVETPKPIATRSGFSACHLLDPAGNVVAAA